MSIISARSTNISVSTFLRGPHPDFPGSSTDIAADTWGNNGMYPLPTEIGEPAEEIQWSELRNRKFFYQNIITSGASGTVSVISPHSSALYGSSGNNYKSAMVDVTNYPTFTWRASATYPNYVGGYYTATNGGGTAILTGTDPNGGTGHVHNLDYTVTGGSYESSATIYVHFINAHA